MRAQSKLLLLACLLLAGGATLRAAEFPTEDQLPKILRKGMTPQEVRATFGAPRTTEERCHKLEYHFYPSLSLLTGEEEGYIGFAVTFEQGRVASWFPIRGSPSYEPPHVPTEVKWIGKFYLFVAVAFILIFGLGRRLWKQAGGVLLVEAFNAREIATAQIPAEFRFITADTTLQEVIERVGEPTSFAPMAVDPRQIKASQLVIGTNGGAAIVVAEYELPNGAAVTIVPEYPFDAPSRIRTVAYRKGFPDLADT